MGNQGQSNRESPQMSPRPSKFNQGSWLVLGILAVAGGAAFFAWQFRSQQSKNVLEFYGGERAAIIRRAKKVEWLDVPTTSDTSADSEPQLSAPFDITSISGLIHARAALISDVSYDWIGEIEPNATDHWDFAIRFHERDETCTLLFDLTRQQLLCRENNQRIGIGDKLSSGMRDLAGRVRETRENSKQ